MRLAGLCVAWTRRPHVSWTHMPLQEVVMCVCVCGPLHRVSQETMSERLRALQKDVATLQADKE